MHRIPEQSTYHSLPVFSRISAAYCRQRIQSRRNSPAQSGKSASSRRKNAVIFLNKLRGQHPYRRNSQATIALPVISPAAFGIYPARCKLGRNSRPGCVGRGRRAGNRALLLRVRVRGRRQVRGTSSKSHVVAFSILRIQDSANCLREVMRSNFPLGSYLPDAGAAHRVPRRGNSDDTECP